MIREQRHHQEDETTGQLKNALKQHLGNGNDNDFCCWINVTWKHALAYRTKVSRP